MDRLNTWQKGMLAGAGALATVLMAGWLFVAAVDAVQGVRDRARVSAETAATVEALIGPAQAKADGSTETAAERAKRLKDTVDAVAAFLAQPTGLSQKGEDGEVPIPMGQFLIMQKNDVLQRVQSQQGKK